MSSKKNEAKKERKADTIPSGTAHRALLKNSQTAPTPPDFTKRRPGSMSRSILALALVAILHLPSSIFATITVTGLVSQITSEALETKIMFTPAADILLLTNGLSAGPAKTISSAANGGFTNTFNPGTYLVRLPLVGGRNAFTIAVPHGNGIENITNLIAAPWTYEQFTNTVSGSGTSGALTNNETRPVTIANDLTVDGFISADQIAGVSFVGSGDGLTNLPVTIAAGTNIVTVTNSGLVTVHGTGDVTQSGLAAGSHAVGMTNRMERWVDATNGLDSWPGTFNQPWKTAGHAVSNTTAGMTIHLASGRYDIGTNTLNVPHQVNLIGHGMPEVFAATQLEYGAAINPGSESLIENIKVVCNTNSIYTLFLAGQHSGYFAGIGVYADGTDDVNKSFTNAIIRDCVVTNAQTDGFYIRSYPGRPSSGTIYNSQFHAFSDAVAGEYNGDTGLHTNSSFVFIGCDLKAEYSALNDDITFGSGSVAQFSRGKFKLVSCTGIGSGLANGANGQVSATDGATVEIIGGTYTSDTTPFYSTAASSIKGYSTFNGTNYTFSGRGTYSTLATATIAATGWTNTMGVNAMVRVTATSTTITIKQRDNSTLDTLTSFTGTVFIPLHPEQAITASSGLAGKATPL